MKRLIVNADDLGYDPEVSRGILEAMRRGVVRSCTFMVNMDDSAAAAREARGLAVGLHLNLARGRPISSAIPAELLGRGELVESQVPALSAQVVEAETLAQLDLLAELLGQPATHVDVHKHKHRYPAVFDGVVSAALARGLPVRALDAPMRLQLRGRGVRTTDHFIGDAGEAAYWTFPQLEAELSRLPEGVTELMCHPGYRPARLKSGYAEQRETELATFLDPRAPGLFERFGIEPIDFRELGRGTNVRL